jgi:RHS repeat-associated protein
MRDGQGLKWTLTYNADTTLKRIANPFGRWIELERTTVNGILCVTRVYSNDGRQITYGYSPWTPTGSIVLTTVNYPAAEQAHYTWVTVDPTVSTARPVLETASDPLFPGGGARTRYVYNYNATFNYGGGPYLVTRMVKEERNLDQNSNVVSLPLGGGNYPQILEGDGTEVTRKFQYGQLTESRDGENRANFYTYATGGFGFLETLTEPNGSVTTYNRDYAGRILSQTDLLGHTRSVAYNGAGFEISRTDERNYATMTTRDSGNRPLRTDYPDSTYETWTYNSYGQPLTHRARKGGTDSFVYYNGTEAGGKLGDLKMLTNALGDVTTFTYADSGQRATIKDARNNITSFAYNWRGKLEAVTHADGTLTHNEYDAFGNRTAQIDELDHLWSYTYDEFNNVASRTDPLGRTTTYEYGREPGCAACSFAAGLTRVTLPSGKKTEYQYDRSLKRTAQIIGAGSNDAATTAYAYTPDGDLEAVTDPRGKRTFFEYDLLHRRTRVVDPLGHATEYSYDPTGNSLTEKRPDNGITAHVYDAMNRRTQRTDANNQVIQFAYDAGDNLVSITDARNNTYTFQYDLLNRKTRMVYPEQSFEQWTFDAMGNATTHSTRAGQVRTFTYDNRNRPTLSDWSDATPDVTSTYDEAGRLLTMASSVSALSYTYDTANQLTSETQQIMTDGGPKSVLYSYDLDGNRAGVGYPSGSSVSYTYTARNQMANVTSDAISASYTYDFAGNPLTKALGNSTIVAYAYDEANRLASVDHQKNGTSFATFDYAYSSTDDRTSRTETVGGTAPVSSSDLYGYDPTDQLTQVKYDFDAGANTQERAVNYAYDAAGNRTSVTDNGTVTPHTANNLNQYTAVDGDTPTYDSNGDLKTQDGWAYSYDAQNRLISAQSAQSAVTFSYDPRNRCVSRTINGTVTFFYYARWTLLEEQSASSALLSRYVHGAKTDELIARITPTTTRYYQHDALGSVIALTDTSGNPTERYSYDVFGRPTFREATGNSVASSESGNRFLFTGRDYILEAGIYDYRNRVYSPLFGRFLQTDPQRFAGGDINFYRYVGNNSPNQTDPLGLYTKAWVSAAVTAEPVDNTCPNCPSKVTGYGYDDGDGSFARARAASAAHDDCEAQKGNLNKGCKAGACILESIEDHPLLGV